MLITTSDAMTEPSLSSLISLSSVCEEVEEPRDAPLEWLGLG